MHPVLFRIGSVTLYTYGALVATGVLLGLWLAGRSAARAGFGPGDVWNLGIYMVLAGVLGAKVWLVIVDWQYYAANPRDIFTLGTFQSGGVYYGGLIAAALVALFYGRRKKMRFLPLADAYAAPLVLGCAIGRLGCFAAGCCWGKPTELAWGVSFNNPLTAEMVGAPLGVRLHPTQLYEAAADFVIFAVLLGLGRRPRFTGQIFGAYAVLYGLVRFAIEFLRGDPGRTLLFGETLSLMQVVSVGLIGLGAWMWNRARTKSEA